MRPVLIYGPTASGKSALALALAERLGGAVINADALQVYADWRVLTARPSEADEARAPHLLYGHVPAARGHSVGDWLRDAERALALCRKKGWRPIVTGGAGLCFRALTEGLADIPPTPAAVRREAERRMSDLGLEAFAAELAARDPATASRIDLRNPARLMRAWEALETTGEGLAGHQDRTPPPLAPLPQAAPLRLAPERERLYARCEARLDEMLAGGAWEEARRVMALDPPASRQAMAALGARELIACLRGEIGPQEARDRTLLATRRFAKRQLTWGRNQMADWPVLEAPDLDQALALLGE